IMRLGPLQNEGAVRRAIGRRLPGLPGEVEEGPVLRRRGRSAQGREVGVKESATASPGFGRPDAAKVCQRNVPESTEVQREYARSRQDAFNSRARGAYARGPS